MFSLYSINKVMKCNIWMSNTSYIFDYNSIFFHDNQLQFDIKLKRIFLTKYIKVLSTFVSGDNQWFINDADPLIRDPHDTKNHDPREGGYDFTSFRLSILLVRYYIKTFKILRTNLSACKHFIVYNYIKENKHLNISHWQ